MTFKERIKAIQDRWYAEERSPMSLDNKWFMDMEIIAEELLKERDAYREVAIRCFRDYPNSPKPDEQEWVDDLAARIMKEAVRDDTNRERKQDSIYRLEVQSETARQEFAKEIKAQSDLYEKQLKVYQEALKELWENPHLGLLYREDVRQKIEGIIGSGGSK